jgi:hypothetical protein
MPTDDLEAIKKRLAPKRVDIDGEQYWVAEGDVLLNAEQLTEYRLQQENLMQQRELHQKAAALGMVPAPPPTTSALVAVADGGKLVRWKDGLVLAYYILRNSFADDREYRMVRQAMESATDAWQRTCGVAFGYVPTLDDNPTPTMEGAKFVVRKYDSGGRFIAAAFFPTDSPDRRRVFIDPSFFADDLIFDRTGVLRHELGHVLGFRHEHIRSEAPAVCPDEDLGDDQPQGVYDPQSVMHYFCGGVGSRELQITDLDVAGAQRVYGLPFSEYTFVE